MSAAPVALAEGLLLAERAGIDRDAAYDVIAGGAAGAPFLHYKRASFLDPDGTPVAFSLELVAKDLELAAALADEVGGAARQLATNRGVVADAVEAGFGSADLSAAAEFLRRARADPLGAGLCKRRTPAYSLQAGTGGGGRWRPAGCGSACSVSSARRATVPRWTSAAGASVPSSPR